MFHATSELGERTMFQEAARWIGMYRRGLEPPVNFPSTLRFPLTITEGKKKSHLRKKKKTFIESLKAEFGLKQVLNISTRGANHLPWLGNAAAAAAAVFSHPSLISRWLCRRLWCFDQSQFNFCKIYMALNKTNLKTTIFQSLKF